MQVLEEFGNLCLKLLRNGFKVNNNIDERYNLEKSTPACDFILKAKAKFGSWTLAAASLIEAWLG
jgi:hypothetical protein